MMDYWETIFRIFSLMIGIGVLAVSVFFLSIGWGAIASGVPFVATFFVGGIIFLLVSLAMFQYSFTGEYAPPWGWWWHGE